MTDRLLRLGCAGGYLEGRIEPGLDLARYGECDYLGLEALNEASLSVLQRMMEHDSERGYHDAGIHRLVMLIEAAGPTTKIVSSVGGANPRAGALRLAAELKRRGHERRIAFVTGDNLTESLGDLVRQGLLRHADGGGAVNAGEIETAFAASAYLGARPIAEALAAGADIVVTGRVVDSALYLGPAMFEFGWDSRDLDLLAAGSAVGHLLECAGHLLGGNYWGPGWQDIDYANIGHGIGEVTDKGRIEVTKLPDASGIIDRNTVAQQLLYEIGDPAAYMLPDVTVDITGVSLHQRGTDRVRVDGVAGRAAPGDAKVLVSCRAGFIAEGMATFTWPDAAQKADLAASALARRLEDVHGVREYHIDVLGTGALAPPPSGPAADQIAEVTLRVAVAAESREQAGAVHREFANFYDCAPAGACGVAGPTSGSQTGVRERVQIMPCLVPAAEVRPAFEIV